MKLSYATKLSTNLVIQSVYYSTTYYSTTYYLATYYLTCKTFYYKAIVEVKDNSGGNKVGGKHITTNILQMMGHVSEIGA